MDKGFNMLNIILSIAFFSTGIALLVLSKKIKADDSCIESQISDSKESEIDFDII